MSEAHLHRGRPRGVNFQEVATILIVRPQMVEWWERTGLINTSYPKTVDSRFLFHDVIQAQCAKALLGVGENSHKRIKVFRPTTQEIREQLQEIRILLRRWKPDLLNTRIFLGQCGEVMFVEGRTEAGQDFLGHFTVVSVSRLWTRTKKVTRGRLPKSFPKIFFESSEEVRLGTPTELPNLHSAFP